MPKEPDKESKAEVRIPDPRYVLEKLELEVQGSVLGAI